ncbi:MAG TPA: hypothetical protein VD978_15355 [Azospirillum sp.]|nr:hypothetical protein [Azospirillum sp.]
MHDTDDLNAARAHALEEGRRLGLPPEWLEHLPRVGELPGSYAVPKHGMDAFLTWKRQEMLARQGRFDELDHALVAEALEDAAIADGPKWLHDTVERVMFALVWPRRTYAMHVEMLMAADHLENCLQDSPSMRLFADLPGCWRSVRHDVQRLDDAIELPEACPWPTLDALRVAVDERTATYNGIT